MKYLILVNFLNSAIIITISMSIVFKEIDKALDIEKTIL